MSLLFNYSNLIKCEKICYYIKLSDLFGLCRNLLVLSNSYCISADVIKYDSSYIKFVAFLLAKFKKDILRFFFNDFAFDNLSNDSFSFTKN